MEKLYLHSTANLVKQSAMQLCYRRKNNIDTVPTINMVENFKSQIEKSKSEYIEMVGSYKVDNHILYFSFDEIVKDGDKYDLVERKELNFPDPKSLYYHTSVIQVALYHSLLLNTSDHNLQTASFMLKMDYPFNKLYINGNSTTRSILVFGKKNYIIEPLNTKGLIDFYIHKMIASLEYGTAKDFDLQFRFKEFGYLNKYIFIKKLKQ